jgi:hypothetical protein
MNQKELDHDYLWGSYCVSGTLLGSLYTQMNKLDTPFKEFIPTFIFIYTVKIKCKYRRDFHHKHQSLGTVDI